MSIENQTHYERRIKFDATINLGHILTFIGFIVTGFSAYTSLNNRVVTLEDAKTMQNTIDHRQDAAIETSAKIQREDFKEINAKLDRLIERANR